MMRRKLIVLLMPPIAVLAGFTGLAPASAAGACNGANTRITVSNVETKSFSDCTLSGISFAGSGGSIENLGNLTLTNVTISDSHATNGAGGAIFNDGTLTLNNVTIISSTASGAGGAIFSRGTLHVNGVTLGGSGSNGNHSEDNGGGIGNTGVVDGTNLTVLGNSAALSGGGVYDVHFRGNTSGNFQVTTGSISNNTAHFDGGGVYVNAVGFNLSGFTISNNTATADHGGGVYVAFSGVATIDKSTVDGNHAHINGGGFMVFGTLALTNSSVQSNSADTGDGGGILDHIDLLHLANDTISGNSAAGNGGGIAEECGAKLEGPVPIVLEAKVIGKFPHTPAPNLTISGNTAGGSGGGLAVSKTTNTNCDRFFQEADLLNPTIADNTAASGGGVWVDGINSSINFANALFARNTPENCLDNGGSGSLEEVGGANLDTGNSCALDVGTNLTDKVNVADPKLGVLADNFGPARTQALLFGSPAIDAVAATDCPPPATDERGTTRPQAATCDIGAYECIGATPTVTQVQPNSGPPTGGTVLAITGTGFDRPATVTFGGTAGVAVTVNSATQITATTPPGKGIEAITVQTCRANNPASSVSAFTFVTLPAAGRAARGSGQELPWAWMLLAILLVCPALGLALLGRRRLSS